MQGKGLRVILTVTEIENLVVASQQIFGLTIMFWLSWYTSCKLKRYRL